MSELLCADRAAVEVTIRLLTPTNARHRRESGTIWCEQMSGECGESVNPTALVDPVAPTRQLAADQPGLATRHRIGRMCIAPTAATRLPPNPDTPERVPPSEARANTKARLSQALRHAPARRQIRASVFAAFVLAP
jgi:hypothetical protein